MCTTTYGSFIATKYFIIQTTHLVKQNEVLWTLQCQSKQKGPESQKCESGHLHLFANTLHLTFNSVHPVFHLLPVTSSDPPSAAPRSTSLIHLHARLTFAWTGKPLFIPNLLPAASFCPHSSVFSFVTQTCQFLELMVSQVFFSCSPSIPEQLHVLHFAHW